jgi:hypothetical protein
VAKIECAGRIEEVREVMENLFWGSSAVFINWLTMRLNTERPIFERAAIQNDLEELQEFGEQQDRPEKKTGQMALL